MRFTKIPNGKFCKKITDGDERIKKWWESDHFILQRLWKSKNWQNCLTFKSGNFSETRSWINFIDVGKMRGTSLSFKTEVNCFSCWKSHNRYYLWTISSSWRSVGTNWGPFAPISGFLGLCYGNLIWALINYVPTNHSLQSSKTSYNV